MKRILIISALAAMLSAQALFAADFSIAVNADAGYQNCSFQPNNDPFILLGADAEIELLFTPKIATAIKIGLTTDLLLPDEALETYLQRMSYATYSMLFKYYMAPQLFIGAGFQYDYWLSRTDYSDDFIVTLFRSVFASVPISHDIGYVTATMGYVVRLKPKLSMPISVNYGYCVLQDDATKKESRMYVKAVVGLKHTF